jgi:hypothetical protein
MANKRAKKVQIEVKCTRVLTGYPIPIKQEPHNLSTLIAVLLKPRSFTDNSRIMNKALDLINKAYDHNKLSPNDWATILESVTDNKPLNARFESLIDNPRPIHREGAD